MTELTRRDFLQVAGALGTVAATAATTITMPAAATPKPENNPMPVDLTRLNAIELSRRIASKAVSCREVMQAYLDHIHRLNPQFKAIVAQQDEAGLLAQADARDRELAAGTVRGWMHGFPLAVKDLAQTRGIVTTSGSPLLKDYVPDHDDIFVERLKAAGGIVIGKTNVPEFGLGSQTYNPVYGTTLNAYDGKSTAGGSSGGAAVALALNLVPVADGSDMMGSLRNPAAFNNVIGFRPSFNRVPFGPTSEVFVQQLGVNGPMGRNVSDLAMLLSTMAGYDPRAPLSLGDDPSVFARPLATEVKGMRIGWLGNFNGYLAMEAGVLETCEKSLTFFEDLGCHVEAVKIDYPMDQLWDCWLAHRHWLIAGGMGALYANPANRLLMKPELLWEIEGIGNYTPQDIYKASVARSQWYETLRKLYLDYDFLVLPSAQVFPFNADIHWPKEIAGRQMDTYHRWMEVVIGGTLSGAPAVNVPAGFGGRYKKPMGLQIWGPIRQDLKVLQMAYAYEQASRWNLDHPSPYLG